MPLTKDDREHAKSCIVYDEQRRIDTYTYAAVAHCSGCHESLTAVSNNAKQVHAMINRKMYKHYEAEHSNMS